MVSKLSHGILLFSLSLSLLFFSAIPLYAACSPYIGLATINEINVHSQSTTADKEDRLVEVKALVPEIISSEIWREWYFIACSALGAAEDSPCSGKIPIQDYYLDGNGDLTPNDPADNSWLLTPVDWPYLDLNASKNNDPRGMTIHLYDENDDLIDFLDVDNYQDPDPSCDFPYDISADGGNDFNIQRLPDGTGDWGGSGGGNSGEQTDNDSNDPVQSDAPRLVITDTEAIAGNDMVFTVSLIDSDPNFPRTDVTIRYSTLDWTALAGVDYVEPLETIITIPKESSFVEVVVATYPNATVGSFFYLQLEEVTSEDKDGKNAIIGFNFGKGTIVAPIGPDHYELSLPTNSINCVPTPITVTACADTSSPCTNAFTAASGETATVSTSGGSLTTTTLTFDANGTASTTLKYPNAPDSTNVSVTFSNESLGAINANQCCPNGTNCVVGNSCTTLFNTAGFIFTDAINAAAANISTQEAGTDSSTYYLRAVRSDDVTGACTAALTGTNPVDIGYECNDPATCYGSNLMNLDAGATTTVARNDNGSVTSFLPVSFTFDADGNAPFTLDYRDVGQVTLHATTTLPDTATTAAATLTGSSNAFVTKPASFELTIPGNPASADAFDPSYFKKAGELFDIEVKAVTAQGDATPSYGRESTPESVSLTNSLVAPAGQNNPPLVGSFNTFGTACDSTAVAGVACGQFSWEEVGIIDLLPEVLDGDYLGTGNVTGTSSGNVGRFIPDSFSVISGLTLSGTLADADGTFSYYGHEIDGYGSNPAFSIEALSVNGNRTTNYQGDFFKLTAADLLITSPATDKVVTTQPVSITRVGATLTSHNDGTATYLFGEDKTTYTRQVSPVAPIVNPEFDFTLTHISDGDTTTSGLSDILPVSGGTELRYGRLVVENSFGPETEAQTMPIATEYWDGTNWQLNGIDSSTVFSYTKVENDITTTEDENGTPVSPTTSTLSILAGTGSTTLTPATDPNDPGGTVDITLETPDWLTFDWDDDLTTADTSPTATATFGIYRGRDRIISWEELPVH